MASAIMAGAIKPIQGTETFPIEVQAFEVMVKDLRTPEQFKEDLVAFEAMAQEKENQKDTIITIAGIVAVLKFIENKEGYESAGFLASRLNYAKITRMAKDFVEGKNTDGNDPNQMPTRFMLLYGYHRY